MTPKTYLAILKTGIFLSFLSVFLVFKELLFPFITSKQLYFNILIEILSVFWIVFLIKYPIYRPKKSWLSFGLISYFVIILLSCFTGVDFNLSFWGDIERMLGFFHILHFLIFYFIIITVMRSFSDWKKLFLVSLVSGAIIAIDTISRTPHYSTIGNTAYISGYLIFNIYFALILIFKEKIKSVKLLYVVAIALMLYAFKFTHTRGAYVGLGISFMVLFLLFFFFSKRLSDEENNIFITQKVIKKLKIISLSLLFFSIVGISLVFSFPKSAIVRSSSILQTITQISSKASTFQTRFISWKAALKDFPNHFIFGTGYGNFAITFDKYFDPSFYDYTRSETYFDRAHNNIVDIATTTGTLGLLSYLSIIFFAFYYLIDCFRKKKINFYDFSFLTCLIIAYFIQNLAVFDSFITYLGLMSLLGYVYWLSNKEILQEEKEEKKPLINKEIYAFLIFGIISLVVINQFNIKPIKMLKGTIKGQIAFNQGAFLVGIEEYKKALEYDTGLDRDSITSLIRAIISNQDALDTMDKEKAREAMGYVIGLSEKIIKYNPNDNLIQMQTARVFELTAKLYKEDSDKFFYYSDRALEAINKAIEASPERIPDRYVKAKILLDRGDSEDAIKVLEDTILLNEKYYDSYCQLGQFHLFLKNEEAGYKAIDKCIDMSGAGTLNSSGLIKNFINHYLDKEDNDRALKLYERLASLEPNDSTILVNLAKLYEMVGDNAKAIITAKKAVELDPSLTDAVKKYIDGLEQEQ